MSNLDIGLIAGGIVLFISLVIYITVLVHKFSCIDRDIRDCERGIAENRQNIFNLRMAITMINDIKINELLLALMVKCGYKIGNFQVRPNFELVKVKKKGDLDYGKERKETKRSQSEKKES